MRDLFGVFLFFEYLYYMVWIQLYEAICLGNLIKSTKGLGPTGCLSKQPIKKIIYRIFPPPLLCFRPLLLLLLLLLGFRRV